MGKFIDLTNQKFGRLTVKYDTGKRNRGRAIWHCICDCGNEIDTLSYYLRCGDTTSCGCYQKERASEKNSKNLIGKKFGKLTVGYQIGRTK